jgi:hypothetical protein
MRNLPYLLHLSMGIALVLRILLQGPLHSEVSEMLTTRWTDAPCTMTTNLIVYSLSATPLMGRAFVRPCGSPGSPQGCPSADSLFSSHTIERLSFGSE